jgi:hypothetical protein
MIADDPIAFIEETLVDPETCKPFRLTAAERTFLCHAFELTPDGRLKYPELAFSGPKKSGKTAFAAMILLYVVRILGGRYAEGVCRGQRLRTGPRASFSGSCAHCRGVAAVTTTVARGPAHAASASGV